MLAAAAVNSAIGLAFVLASGNGHNEYRGLLGATFVVAGQVWAAAWCVIDQMRERVHVVNNYSGGSGGQGGSSSGGGGGGGGSGWPGGQGGAGGRGGSSSARSPRSAP